MIQDFNHDTIVAISTPPGEGGIAVIRLSGSEAVRVVMDHFQGKSNLLTSPSHTAHHGWLMHGDDPVDEVIVTVFRAPDSYTGEDVAEISCHGGTFVSQKLLDLMIASGARPAQPGEFTQRAFLNAKIDLSQAEAIADLIHAKTDASRRVAVNTLRGHLSGGLEKIRQELIGCCAALEVELDFADEDAGEVSRDEVATGLASIRQEMDRLLRTYERGKACRDGVRLVIVGRPNVGKSSILNALVEKERAIVTEVPGTTRDTVEDVLDIEGLLFHVTDTAGLREAGDPLEREGVRRAEKAMEAADLFLLVFDGSEPFKPEDEKIFHRLRTQEQEMVVVINKVDLSQCLDTDMIKPDNHREELLHVSALTKQGMPELIEKLKQRALSGGIPETGETILTRTRHRDLLEKAVASVRRAETALSRSMSPEFIVLDLRGALDLLGELTGSTTTDDILGRIFSDFCIGK